MTKVTWRKIGDTSGQTYSKTYRRKLTGWDMTKIQVQLAISGCELMGVVGL